MMTAVLEVADVMTDQLALLLFQLLFATTVAVTIAASANLLIARCCAAIRHRIWALARWQSLASSAVVRKTPDSALRSVCGCWCGHMDASVGDYGAR